MATVSELDEKIEEQKRKIAHLEERKKALIAKEREQARKYKAATVTAVGETVLRVLDADWTRIDLANLQAWLKEYSRDLGIVAVTGERTPSEAKAALDAFKRSLRPSKPAALEVELDDALDAMDGMDDDGCEPLEQPQEQHPQNSW